jgi:SAM-dependent methyltransferase
MTHRQLAESGKLKAKSQRKPTHPTNYARRSVSGFQLSALSFPLRRKDMQTRLRPSWWDHQRHVLAELAACLQRLVRAQADSIRGSVVLDLGCGDAPYRPLFEHQGCGRYVRCDLDGEVDVRIVPGEPLPLANASVDWVASFQVLEHVWNLDEYLGEARRVLKPGGRLLLSTHGTWPYHPHPTDFRRWTRVGLQRELEARGFEIQEMHAVVGPLAWTTQIRLLGLREALRRIPVLRGLLLPPIIVLMNVRMVLEDAITPARIRNDNACVYVVLAHPAVAPS